MYYPESERFAAEQPELRDLIREVDEAIRRGAPGDLLDATILADVLGLDRNQVGAVLEYLERHGVLRIETMVECDGCGTLSPIEEVRSARKDGDEYECSNCRTDLAKGHHGTKYVFTRIKAPSGKSSEHALPSTDVAAGPSVGGGIGESLSPGFLEDVFQHAPLLSYFSKHGALVEVQPFSGKNVLLLVHFLRDLVPFVRAAEHLGLEPSRTVLFYKMYPYPQRQAITDWLQGEGYRVLPVRMIDAMLGELAAADADALPLLVVEDGGHLVPRILSNHLALARRTVGAVEQTSRGIWNVERWLTGSPGRELPFPLLSVAGSELKAKLEPPHIGQAAVANLRRLLPDVSIPGSTFTVLGFGAIGALVAKSLRDLGARVAVFDEAPSRLLDARNQAFATYATAPEAVRASSLVVGCSGSQSINALVISALPHDAKLMSASSEQYEIDLEELERQSAKSAEWKNSRGELIGMSYELRGRSRTVHVLANGYPINFWGADSMPGQASDIILTLLLLAAGEVGAGRITTPGVSDTVINDLAGVTNYDVAAKYLQFYGP